MAELTALGLERKAAAVHAQLAAALARHGRLVYSNSLGAEAMVLTDIIATQLPEIDMFSIDTGRLYEETHELLEKLQRRYRRAIRVVYPDAAALERLVARQGVNGFYHSLEARLECCRIRKVEPFKRAIVGYDGWITGLRREQSAARAAAEAVEWDAEHGLYKVSPLLEWTEAEVWQYIRARRLPYNPLHDRQFPSIGCAPCTRAIQPGESRRAGRWWWEQPETRECGLHPRVPPAALPA
ncbi:MAG: phosphoadenylyl-sulfate reductase [Gammaproteobacteria bacterium]|nr:MAG: phosphoadenylyl-sulfate reductase [Gammaproteobacteria bacterium]TLZ07395.1 MAG: phosphoadenylyl-sulfate reductase [Gammaproteobacteria bacterium]TLZ11956.1 MAG: phosphoadenylyl-sulfate reductase [Gammaproteobacteria bacterium]TLZ28239.1 MAG: phosphoadenylyl-sulfate reductase [Gammaproteobacteria bacterium]